MDLAALCYEALGVLPSDSSFQWQQDVRGIAQDSRRVDDGYVFVARRGLLVDGHRFLKEVVSRGAIAIVGEASPQEQATWQHEIPLSIPYIQVADDKAALSQLAHCFFGKPSTKLYTIGITGTDGKTTTSSLLHHLLRAKLSTGLLSTASVVAGAEVLETVGHFTTPEASEVQAFLARFVEAGCTHAVVESSSHALAMQRLADVQYDLALWTNLSPEHLDYHQSLEAYRDAKAELARKAPQSILNKDDEHFAYFASQAQSYQSYSLHDDGADWYAYDLEQSPQGLTFSLASTAFKGDYRARLAMIGSYNVYNALAASAAAFAIGLSIDDILTGLASFQGVAGRMQRVYQGHFQVVVDFAHTAQALEKVLKAVRPQVAGRIITVIGAAGERDPGKRFPIGEAAVRCGDMVVFTEEDSRSEATSEIFKELGRGALAAGGELEHNVFFKENRQAAIKQALHLAQAKDLVLLCGKGHENTLERREETLVWDEAAIAKQSLADLGYLSYP